MAKRGPKPRPTALKVLHGTRPDRVNRSEPQPAEQAIVPPYELSAEAQALWDQLAPDRIAKGCLTPWDVHAFAAFVEGLVILRRAHEEPAGVWRSVLGICDRLGSKFGWTPSDRAALNLRDLSKNTDDDLISKYLS